jgi:hypothetical protein
MHPLVVPGIKEIQILKYKYVERRKNFTELKAARIELNIAFSNLERFNKPIFQCLKCF